MRFMCRSGTAPAPAPPRAAATPAADARWLLRAGGVTDEPDDDPDDEELEDDDDDDEADDDDESEVELDATLSASDAARRRLALAVTSL
jgi:hypothetical protein